MREDLVRLCARLHRLVTTTGYTGDAAPSPPQSDGEGGDGRGNGVTEPRPRGRRCDTCDTSPTHTGPTMIPRREVLRSVWPERLVSVRVAAVREHGPRPALEPAFSYVITGENLSPSGSASSKTVPRLLSCCRVASAPTATYRRRGGTGGCRGQRRPARTGSCTSRCHRCTAGTASLRASQTTTKRPPGRASLALDSGQVGIAVALFVHLPEPLTGPESRYLPDQVDPGGIPTTRISASLSGWTASRRGSIPVHEVHRRRESEPVGLRHDDEGARSPPKAP